jgi:hypothetical protein
VGSGSLRHCPQCDLDVPDMSALTAAEARRVLDALRCAYERSEDLHFCSSYPLDDDGHAVFFDPAQLPSTPGLDLSGLVDTTPKLLIAMAALSTLGLTAHIEVFERYLSPAWQGHPVFVLDEDGPRLEPERVDAFTDAVDASEDAWLTLNLAAWRRDLVDALSPRARFEKANASVMMGGDMF